MSNRLKRNLALAGISSSCYTSYDMEMVEQFKQTNEYKNWKKSKNDEVSKLAKKRKGASYKKIYEEVYKDYKPSYLKYKVVSNPRLTV